MIELGDVSELPQHISTQEFLQDILEWYGHSENTIEQQVLEAVVDTACFYLYD